MDKPSHAPQTPRPQPLVARVAQTLRQRQLVSDSQDSVRVVVGVSGGADSVCLLHLLAMLAPDMHLHLHVAHLNHGLRPEADQEMQFVADLAQTLGLSFHHETLPPHALQGTPGGLEAAARQARYAFLCRVARQASQNVGAAAPVPHSASDAMTSPLVAVAHNADDQAETLLLHLVRGTGLRGLAGMRWKTRIHVAAFDPTVATEAIEMAAQQPLWLIRPLLDVHRAEIVAFLRQQGIGWMVDASNQATAFTRNRLRSQVFPQLAAINPQVVDAMARSAAIVADAEERLIQIDLAEMAALRYDATGRQHAVDPERFAAAPRVVLDLDGLAKLARPAQRGVLRQALAHLERMHPDEQFSPVPTGDNQVRFPPQYPRTGQEIGQNALHDMDFATVELLLKRAVATTAQSGPHPLTGAMRWSVLSADGDCPRRLSLHQAAVLPIAPPGPHLGAHWRPQPLPVQDGVTTHGWRLLGRTVDRTALPDRWDHVSRWEAWLDAERVGTPVLGTPAAGMRVEPLGMGGRTKALGDLFTDVKVHPALRPGWPLLIDGREGTILWVCGLQMAHAARITAETARVLHLRWSLETEETP